MASSPSSMPAAARQGGDGGCEYHSQWRRRAARRYAAAVEAGEPGAGTATSSRPRRGRRGVTSPRAAGGSRAAAGMRQRAGSRAPASRPVADGRAGHRRRRRRLAPGRANLPASPANRRHRHYLDDTSSMMPAASRRLHEAEDRAAPESPQAVPAIASRFARCHGDHDGGSLGAGESGESSRRARYRREVYHDDRVEGDDTSTYDFRAARVLLALTGRSPPRRPPRRSYRFSQAVAPPLRRHALSRASGRCRSPPSRRRRRRLGTYLPSTRGTPAAGQRLARGRATA